VRWSLNAPLFFLSDLCRRIGSSLVSKESKTPKPKRRWLRRSLWLCLVLALLGVAAIGYLNQVGLPDFAKRELQERLAKLAEPVRVDLGDSLLKVNGNGVRPAGMVKSPKTLTQK